MLKKDWEITTFHKYRDPTIRGNMANSRRVFLKKAVMAGGFLTMHPLQNQSASSHFSKGSPANRRSNPMKILILGGTSFLGPYQIAYALERGHEISIFTRGRTQPMIYPSQFQYVEHLIGDRADNLTALEGRSWDAVIDNSGHQVAWTRDSAQLLKDNVELYLYTSSSGVYYPYLLDDNKEDQPLNLEVPEGVEGDEKIEYDYGVMKALSEIEARKAFGADRTINVRPTYMIGPGDRSDRFNYWPVRIDRGGEVLVPGKRDDPVQYIDVRDVANWMIRLLEERKTGDFNAVGPASKTGMHAFVHGVHAATSSAVTWVYVDDYDFLLEHNVPYVIPWIMPVGNNYGSARANTERSFANGLTVRPLADTMQDILPWWYSDVVPEDRRTRLLEGENALMVREPGIIDAWRSR